MNIFKTYPTPTEHLPVLGQLGSVKFQINTPLSFKDTIH